MKVSPEDVHRVAELANLELTASEETAMLRDLNSILGHIAQLNELETASVPAMAQVAEVTGAGPEPGGEHGLRPDQTGPSLDRGQVMPCAPDTDGVYFRVPKVIER